MAVTKKILRFYFGAKSLERAFDNLIERKAFDMESDTLETAEGLCAVIGEKMRLERLWAYLDGIISALSCAERTALKRYSDRGGLRGESDKKAAKRAVMKFTRHARRLKDFDDDFTLLKKYFYLIKV